MAQFSFKKDLSFIFFWIQYGFTFGITHLAAMIGSPLCAKYSEAIGSKKLYTVGVIALALSTVSFGVLSYTRDKLVFLGASYSLR